MKGGGKLALTSISFGAIQHMRGACKAYFKVHFVILIICVH